MSITILNRIDIDIDWYFSAISFGFTVHKRGFQLSLIFIDISVYYFSPKWRRDAAAKIKKYTEMAEKLIAE